ncbi:HIT family protein [Tetragenococcus muriaticus]|uniref:Histidine triad (HIT) nucleotide-binding protein n=2 Tax=Tetragenococcus muriaticus TaxID=64642 RepID=A0A091C7Y4_9ENTE|nr:HIT family protein [Tetragenococcus muriaticus]KFN93054.1 histidine triad (HIT) nucleotide-binding protein [Tetragenococcus muriaticus 3MR10-3]KFN93565.1 histidine triad (HIT) nucleotide-binding protein [Tetragenococcus muriaticus PMC-11-5]GMA48326.1 histidine triad protein [Tetragenococcus muriaticus]
MTDCIFCKIKDQEIPNYKVYEDDKVYAFLDMSQVTQGHTLLIPKRHVSDIFEYDKQLATDLSTRLPKIAQALRTAFPEIEGLNIINNNGEVAYQSVFHSHIHLIPRYGKDDDFSMHFGDHSEQWTQDEMTETAQKIKVQVNGDV